MQDQQEGSEEASNSVRIDSVDVLLTPNEWLVYLTDHHTPAIWTFPLSPHWAEADKPRLRREAINSALKGQMSKTLVSSVCF